MPETLDSLNGRDRLQVSCSCSNIICNVHICRYHTCAYCPYSLFIDRPEHLNDMEVSVSNANQRGFHIVRVVLLMVCQSTPQSSFLSPHRQLPLSLPATCYQEHTSRVTICRPLSQPADLPYLLAINENRTERILPGSKPELWSNSPSQLIPGSEYGLPDNIVAFL